MEDDDEDEYYDSDATVSVFELQDSGYRRDCLVPSA